MIVAKRTTDGKARFYCPGCGENHAVTIDGPHAWDFNGNFERPTFRPSVLVRSSQLKRDENGRWIGDWLRDDAGNPLPLICHSFVTDGVIEYLGDCTHALAGQSVPLPAIDEVK